VEYPLGSSLFHLGELTTAREHLEQAISFHDPRHQSSYVSRFGADPRVSCLFYTSHVLWHLGYPDLALEKSHEALALTRDLSHSFTTVIALDYAAMLHQFRREEQAARERAEKAISLCGDQGFAYYLAWGPIIQGWSLAEQGEDGIAQLQRGLETLRATGARLRRPYYLALLAEACVKAGEAEEGMSLLDEALTAMRATGERYYEAEQYPDDWTMRVSHETIYRTLFVQSKGALKKELLSHLRSGRTMRHSRNASKTRPQRGQIKDAVSIRERPPEAEDRAVPGHWEGDLLLGSRSTYVATLVERSSRFVMLVRLRSKDTTSVVGALSQQVKRLPTTLMETLTWDRGTEMANHKYFTIATDVAVYFCDPSSPWQRGTNENTNRLLRQYLPKGADLSVHSQHDLDMIALKLNTRPRKTLGYRTPADTLEETVALTG
jgi:IS30 family transposase